MSNKTGRVKFFNDAKGFGFIKEDNSESEYFVHVSGIKEETLNEDNELDKYQKEREQKRKEELVKRTQISVAKPFSFSETGKKDPCRGMRWVNPFESINQTRLGHSQSWRGNKSKKEFY